MSSESTIKRETIHSDHENSWRAKFPTKIVLSLSLIQTLLTLIILILEIASLGVIFGDRPTGVGIWCALPFLIASILTFLLGQYLVR
jgi:hypothetical protein